MFLIVDKNYQKTSNPGHGKLGFFTTCLFPGYCGKKYVDKNFPGRFVYNTVMNVSDI